MPIPTTIRTHHDELTRALRRHIDDVEAGRFTNDAEARAAYDRINIELTNVEARIAEFKALDARDRRSAEARANSDDLARQCAGGNGLEAERSGRYGDVAEWRSLNGRDPSHLVAIGLPDTEGRALAAGTSTAGAEAVQHSVASEFINSLTAHSPVLEMARLILTDSGGALDFPRRTSIGTADAEVAEGTALTEDDPTFDAVTFAAWKYGSLVKASTELLTDAEPDVIAEIAASLGEATARAYEPKLVTGAGTTEPVGFMAGITTGVTAASATALTADELIDLTMSIASPYWSQGPAFAMNAATLGEVRKLKDASGAYLLAYSQRERGVDGSPHTPRLLGHDVRIVDDMADIATGNASVAFGVFDRFYGVRVVGRERQVAIDSSVDFAFDTDQVTWRSRIRLDGQVLDVNAAKSLVHP